MWEPEIGFFNILTNHELKVLMQCYVDHDNTVNMPQTVTLSHSELPTTEAPMHEEGTFYLNIAV